MPPAVEGAPRAFGGLGPDIPGSRPVRYVVGGIAKDGPEDRGLSERCIVGFNSGPPFVPSLYNNNMQIVQNRDTAVIFTEMIHDARIVPLVEAPVLDEDIRLWSGDSRLVGGELSGRANAKFQWVSTDVQQHRHQLRHGVDRAVYPHGV